jgi:uncharacterized membrane protein (DUF106 family)
VAILDNQVFQLFMISVVAVIVQNLLFKKLSDQASLRELKKQLASVQIRMKEAQKEKDTAKMDKVLKQMNELSMKRMQLTMKPNLLSSAIFILALGWVQKTYQHLAVQMPIPLPVLHWKFPLVFLEPTLTWFWWYFYIALLASIIVREVLEIEI